MYKLIEFLMEMSSSTSSTTAASANNDDEHLPTAAAAVSHHTRLLSVEQRPQPEVVIKRHARYFKRFLELLPAKLALHDSTR